MTRLLAAAASLAAFIGTASAGTVVLDFDTLSAGDVVTTQYAGVTITGNEARRGHGAMVFDSRNATGGDRDLAGPFLSEDGQSTYAPGNILILSEDGDSTDPDDSARGGTITLDFAQAVTFGGFNAFDINGAESITLELYDATGILVASFDNGSRTVADNGFLSFQRLCVENVSRAVFILAGSGAIDDISFDAAPVPVPAAGLLFATGLAGAGFARRRRAA